MIASKDDKPRFSSEGDAATHNHAASTKRGYSLQRSLFSAPSAHAGLSIEKCRRRNLDSKLDQAPDCQQLGVPEAQNKSQ